MSQWPHASTKSTTRAPAMRLRFTRNLRCATLSARLEFARNGRRDWSNTHLKYILISARISNYFVMWDMTSRVSVICLGASPLSFRSSDALMHIEYFLL
jgi:hypothetical protein